MKETLVIEPKFLRQFLAIFHDLETGSELHGRKVAHLLEQREVTIRLYVAGDPRVAVPVPGAAHIAAFLTKTDIFESRVFQFIPK